MTNLSVKLQPQQETRIAARAPENSRGRIQQLSAEFLCNETILGSYFPLNVQGNSTILSIIAGYVQSQPAHTQCLPIECFINIFTYLDSHEMALAERVCRSWQSMINQEQYAWQEQCRNQAICVISPHIETALRSYSSQIAPGKFDSKILSIITAYEDCGVMYKTFASYIHGKLFLDVPGSTYVHMRDKIAGQSWGNDNQEPFMPIAIYNEESERECRAHHRGGPFGGCTKYGYQGSWFDACPSKLPDFPNALPLRLFINQDGSYKQAGDTIKLRYNNQAVVLTCCYRETLGREHRHITTFAEGLAYRVDLSYRCHMISYNTEDQAKAAARNAPEWTSSQ
jgi:hypothetical protein